MSSRYPSREQLMDDAVATTGLDDFGPGDFREGLDVLLLSLSEDAGLARSTDERVLGDLRRRLRNRLLVERWYADHPELDAMAPEGPVDVCGLPRTGTTAIGNMLSLEPRLRPMRGWEQADPVPPPVLATERTDPRRLGAIQADADLPPEAHAMHLYDADAALEDTDVLGMAFHGQQMVLPVYGYHDWWRRSDMRQAFAYHRRIAVLLQSQRPPDRWLFKCPHHKFHLEHLVDAYPEALFVWTHRDPARVVPSYSSLVGSILPEAADPAGHDQVRLGHEICEHLRIGTVMAMEQRERLGEGRFLDVHHGDLHHDPMGTMQRIYDFVGLELTGAVEASLARWQALNRSGAKGTHRYTPEQFGLTAEQIREAYDPYIRRFDVRLER